MQIFVQFYLCFLLFFVCRSTLFWAIHISVYELFQGLWEKTILLRCLYSSSCWPKNQEKYHILRYCKYSCNFNGDFPVFPVIFSCLAAHSFQLFILKVSTFMLWTLGENNFTSILMFFILLTKTSRKISCWQSDAGLKALYSSI